MPTSQGTRRKRFIAAGHFVESPGYRIDRPTGCHDWLLIYTLRGHGQFTQGDLEVSARANDAFLIAPETRHCYELPADSRKWEFLWAHFVPPTEWKAWLKWHRVTPGWWQVQLSSPTLRKQVVARFHEVMYLTAGYRHHREALALNALEAVLLGCHEQFVVERGQGVDARISDVLDYICRHLDRPLGIRELARESHLSESRFAHLFREQMEMTPLQFIEQQRIERARQLLEHTSYAISEIAKQVGITNAFYFSRRFRQAVGVSPRAYRDQLS